MQYKQKPVDRKRILKVGKSNEARQLTKESIPGKNFISFLDEMYDTNKYHNHWRSTLLLKQETKNYIKNLITSIEIDYESCKQTVNVNKLAIWNEESITLMHVVMAFNISEYINTFQDLSTVNNTQRSHLHLLCDSLIDKYHKQSTMNYSNKLVMLTSGIDQLIFSYNLELTSLKYIPQNTETNNSRTCDLLRQNAKMEQKIQASSILKSKLTRIKNEILNSQTLPSVKTSPAIIQPLRNYIKFIMELDNTREEIIKAIKINSAHRMINWFKALLSHNHKLNIYLFKSKVEKAWARLHKIYV